MPLIIVPWKSQPTSAITTTTPPTAARTRIYDEFLDVIYRMVR
jgi:hypothetical protein